MKPLLAAVAPVLVLLLHGAPASGAPASATAQPTPPPAPPPAGVARDPFAGPGGLPFDPSKGLPGMAWQHFRLSGVMTTKSGPVATLDAGAAGTFVAHEGDRLANAVVVAIDPRRRAVLLREPAPETVAGYREVALSMDSGPVVAAPRAAEPVLPVGAAK